MIDITSPVIGATVGGLTSPTYTFTADAAPFPNGKQYAVSALGGTQAAVSVHSISRPFTCTWVRPKVFRLLGNPDATGIVRNVPRNVWKLITRKGALPASSQPAQVAIVETNISIPAGTEAQSLNELKAALSAHIGVLQQQLVNLGDSLGTGLL